MAAIILGILGALGRYVQGNGHAGVGRWAVIGFSIAAAYVSLARGSDAGWVAYVLALWAGLAGGANTGFGHTRWEDIPYSIVRYSLPPLMAVLPWAVWSSDTHVLLYVLVGPGIAVGQYTLAQHKPAWLTRLVGGRDVATLPAGFLVVAGLAAL